jgi:uncharacterized protein YuzE
MRITFDPAADAAMIYLVDAVPDAAVARSEVCDVEFDGGAVILDLDADDRLLAIEVLGASKILPADVVAQAAPERPVG